MRAWYRAIERGQLEAVHPGVCRMFGADRSAAQSIHAVLAAGRGAMASHRSAARLWGIPRPADEEVVDIVLPPPQP